MLRRVMRVSRRLDAVWRLRSQRITVQAAVNAHDSAKAAVADCLERVLGSGANTPATTFAVLFFEGHDQAGVQDALNSFAQRRPQAPPVIGCSLGENAYERQTRRLRQDQSARRLALISAPSTGKPGQKLLPWSPPSPSETDWSQELPDPFRSPKIVTVLGLGFEKEDAKGGDKVGGDGGRIEALPVYAEGGSFPNIAGKDSVSRIFGMPREKPPLFFLLSQDDQSQDLQETNRRLENLLPMSGRLCALSSGDPSSVVSTFPVGDAEAPVRGVCLMGDISLQEQARLARKTLGAFGFSAIIVSGDVCNELFVPAHPSAAESGSLSSAFSSEAAATTKAGGTLERVQETLRMAVRQAERERRWKEQQRQQLGVFKVDEVVFPGMTRRFRIFEPRYRALVKQCLADDVPLVMLPLSRGGNTVATAARVTGLFNVEEDGRCEVEITGIARCKVKTMWMKGESFGLFEAEVELFADEDYNQGAVAAEGREGVEKDEEGISRARHAAGASGRAAMSGDGAGKREGAGAGTGARDGIAEEVGLAANLPELERLRIEVSAIMQKELHRTRTQGRSPLWPGWDGSVSRNDALAAFAATPPLPTPLLIKTAGDDNGDGEGGGEESQGGQGSGGTTAAEPKTGIDSRGGGGGIGGMDPCDLDAEALSFWAAQNVEAGALVKHEWLSSTSTAERLRGVRDLCRFALARHRDRSGVDGAILSRPLSALRDLTFR